MKKIIVSALIIAGFAVAAMAAPGFKIKIVETQAAACLGGADCNSGGG